MFCCIHFQYIIRKYKLNVLLEYVYTRPEVKSNRFESQTALKCHSVHMEIRMEISKQQQDSILHMCKWYLLVNANLINAKQMLRYWLFFKQW